MRRALPIVTIVSLLVLLAAPAAPARAQDDRPIDLRLRLHAGDAFDQTIALQQQITTGPEGSQQQIQQEMTFGYRMAVKGVDEEGVATVRAVYDRVRFEQQGGGASVEYDSADAPEIVPPSARPMAAMVGQGFTFRIGARGEVKEVTGVDEMMEHVMEAVQLPPGVDREAFVGPLKEQFGDKAVRQMLEQSMSIYPDKPVKVGDSWSREMKLPRLIAATTYTLTAVEDGHAVLSVESTLAPNPEDDELVMGPMTMRFTQVEGTQSGEARVDLATGWTATAELDQDITMRLSVQQANQPAVELPTRTVGTITITGGRAAETQPAERAAD